MAAGYTCAFGDEPHNATVIMTWLDRGSTIAFCDDDLPVALVNILAVDMGIDPTRFYDAVKRHVDKEAKRQRAEAEKDTPDAEATVPATGSGESTPEEIEADATDRQEIEEVGLFHGFGEEAL